MALKQFAVRRSLLPLTDLDAQGEPGGMQTIPGDIAPMLAILSAQSDIAAKLLACTQQGWLLTDTDDDSNLATHLYQIESSLVQVINRLASIQTALANFPYGVFGTQGNLWDNIAVGVGGASAVANIDQYSVLTVLGHASAATTITLKLSSDDVTFYTHSTVVLAVAGDFVFNIIVGAPFVMLTSSAAATITATATAKV